MIQTARTVSSMLVLLLLLTALPAFATGPTLLHPDSSVPEYVSLPYFDWDDVTAPYEGSYEIQVDDTSSFSSPVATATIPAFISFYSPHEELSPGSYYWRVRYLPVTGAPSAWSQSQFSLYAVSNIFTVAANPTWQDVKNKLQEALDYADEHPQEFVEIRLPAGEGDIVLTQPTCPTNVTRSECPSSDDDPPHCSEDEEGDYLFYVRGHDNVIVNGMNRKVVIHAQRRVAGFYFAQGAHHLQLKNVVVDYAPDSLSQFGGEIVAIDDDGIGVDSNGNPDTGHRDATTNIPTPASGTPTRGFTVTVDPGVYGNLAEFEPVKCGFFVDAENHQRIGRQGVVYNMNETWQGARVGTSHTYRFTELSQTWWSRYAGELKVGDFFVSTDRGGDLIFLKAGVEDFVANNVTSHASRGRYFIIHNGTNVRFIRSIGNGFLRTQDRILGAPSGGVNDHGTATWYENTTFEYTRDDAYHTGNPEGSENVLLNSAITGAFRNSAWIQADRSWIEGNTIAHAGTDGIALGGAGIESTVNAQVSVGLIKDNEIISPRRAGIVSRPPFSVALPDAENQHITLTGNTVRDHQSNEAILLEYLTDSVVSGNKVESTGIARYPFNSPWRLYSDPALQMGFHVASSQDVGGAGNEVTDPRIACEDRLVVESSASNITLGLTAPSSGAHESWNCATVAAFTSAGTLAGDHDWTINAPNFRVEVLDHSLLGSRGFGRVVSDVLPGKSATALDTHTMTLPQTLAPSTNAIRLQARFVFNELTTLGRGEVRFGVEDSTTGVLYAVGLATTTTANPVTLYAVNTNNLADLGTAGDQSTSGAWEVDATFRRVSSTATTIDYLVRRPNGASYSGTTTLSNAVVTTTAFDKVFLAFKQRGQVVFDFIQVTTPD